ncbi:MAG: branched-chain amino acid aminotransferase [Acetobacteraceae bacterium]
MALLPFDDRDGMIWLDGRMVLWREAKLHVLSHGLHYASAVFEGERAYGSTVFRLRIHTERLQNSAHLLGFALPWRADEIAHATDAVLQANQLSDAYVRPIAWRGAEQLSVAAQQTKIHLAIAAWPWPNLFAAERMRGVRLGIAKWRRPSPETAPTAAKASGLYMIGTLAKHEAQAAGLDDALMLDWRGQVAEATAANIFLAIDGALHTPTPEGFLDGITRRTVMSLARRRGIRVVERAIMPDALAAASEVLLAGTAAEVTPVREIGPHRYMPGQISEAIAADYAALVRMPPEEVARRAA